MEDLICLLATVRTLKEFIDVDIDKLKSKLKGRCGCISHVNPKSNSDNVYGKRN